MTHASFQSVPQSDYRPLHPEKKRGTVILALRTDKPQAELYLYANSQQLAAIKWQAHRKLAETIHKQIKELLQGQSLSQGLSLQAIEGIICFKGPGSFTGLRIGLSVANALAYANQIPVVARMGDDWLEQGIRDLLAGKNDKIATPYYNMPANTSTPKK